MARPTIGIFLVPLSFLMMALVAEAQPRATAPRAYRASRVGLTGATQWPTMLTG
jgi:tellurite resistance protein TehA-like permease